MRQDFVYNNACVIPDINIFDTHSGYLLNSKGKKKSNQETTTTTGDIANLSNHYPSKRIRYWCIHSNDVEFYRPIGKTLDSYIQFLPLRTSFIQQPKKMFDGVINNAPFWILIDSKKNLSLDHVLEILYLRRWLYAPAVFRQVYVCQRIVKA